MPDVPARQVVMGLEGGELQGDLTAGPALNRGLVIFAHGSGSGRHSPRNRLVAATLQDAGLATLLFDLLSEEEEEIDQRTAQLRFDIRLLAGRLVAVTDWAMQQADVGGLPVGYFGASTGAAAALVAAAARPAAVAAVVSRGGRPDLAAETLAAVEAPTLLIVGGRDEPVLGLNRLALERLHCPREIAVVPGATHLFEEPDALEEVARLATAWFTRHLAGAPPG